MISRRVLASFSTEAPAKKVTLPELKFAYSALEPVISSKLLETHHKKHHQTYVNNLNAALDQFEGTPNPTQRPRPTLTTTVSLLSARLSSSTWEAISTIRSTGKTWPLLVREEANTLLLSLPFLSRSPSNSVLTRTWLRSSPKRPFLFKALDGDG